MNRYFYLSETVVLRRKRWFKQEICVARVTGLPVDNGGFYTVQIQNAGAIIKVSPDDLLENKAFWPWKMYKAVDRA
jgi:hypothetical protein